MKSPHTMQAAVDTHKAIHEKIRESAEKQMAAMVGNIDKGTHSPVTENRAGE